VARRHGGVGVVSASVVVLVGPRGAGKSTVGPLVAAQLARPFFDADLELGAHVGMGASEFLRQRGEAEFRCVEDEVSSRLLDQDGVVVALGGGGILCPGVAARLASPRVFCALLLAPVATLCLRLQAAPRPPLTGLSLEEEVLALLDRRLPRYRELAACEVDTSQAFPEDCARRIVDALRGR
jgi:shikimate kinase